MRSLFALIALVSVLSLAACHRDSKMGHGHDHAMMVTKAVAVMQPTAGNTAGGTVTLTQADGKVTIVASIQGLTANAQHAIHIHEFGDISKPDGTGTGGHYNPEGHAHALPDKATRHAGDLGNLTADANGSAEYTITVDNITLAGRNNAVLGRGIIIHAKVDDGGQPTGNAGARISQGVIAVANAAPPAAK